MTRPLVSRVLSQGVGSTGFVAAHGLYSTEQEQAAADVAARIQEAGLRTVRLVIVDQHGAPRAKYLSGDAAVSALHNGSDFSGAIYSLDTGNCVFPPPFAVGGGFGIEEFTGFPDISIVPDPSTFRILPWADRTGWILCDAYFSNGRPVPLDGRAVLRRQLARLSERGYGCATGLEVEFYITRPARKTIAANDIGQPGPALAVEPFQLGYQFMSDGRLDGVSATLETLRDGLWEVGLEPRSMEEEWGPGQFEFTFGPMLGLAAADAMVLFRSAVKALCARQGLHATFMCWPGLPSFFPSGWHLHQSLVDGATGRNAFCCDTDFLSATGRHWVAGLIRHAKAMAVFGDPTVNAYPRFRPYSFAPDRIGWARDNRGTLIRVQGGPGDASTHVENRLGEPAANPYLWLAANIAAGLDGLAIGDEPPPIATGDPYAVEAELLPASLTAAVDCLDASTLYRREFGDSFVDYLVMMKRFECARHAEAVAVEPPAEGSGVSDWEMREYLEFF